MLSERSLESVLLLLVALVLTVLVLTVLVLMLVALLTVWVRVEETLVVVVAEAVDELMVGEATVDNAEGAVVKVEVVVVRVEVVVAAVAEVTFPGLLLTLLG